MRCCVRGILCVWCLVTGKNRNQCCRSAWGVYYRDGESSLSKSYFLSLLTFAFTAGFEEIVFRYILPESMQHIIKSKNNEKYKIISCEIITAILFGLCHNYLGLLAVLNGVCAHFIFRLCYKKTGNLLFNCSIHFLYNVTNVFICSI